MRVPATVLVVLGALGLSGEPALSSAGPLSDRGAGVVFAPDGNLWHTTTRSLAATTLAGASTSIPLPGDADAGALTMGDDGGLWFVHDERAIWRLGAGGLPTVFDDLPVELNDIAAGPDGNVWFAGAPASKGAGRGAIGRITPQGEVTVFGDGISGEPAALAPGTDGAVWFTEPKARRVGRIDPAGAVTETVVGGRPTGIAAGSDRGMWFTDAGGSIGRIAPDGTVTGYDGAGKRPGDIAMGADGQLWYTLEHGIGQVRTDGTITTWDLGDAEPVALAGAPDAAMYFTDARESRLGRFDIRTPAGAGASGGNGKRPEPQVSETVVVAPESGDVRVRPPGQGFVALPAASAIPVGSIVDTRNGAVALSSAIGSGTQTGTFRGGLFKVRQRPSGRTDLYLRGRLDCAASASTATTARKRRKRRKIWGTDSGGAFSTHGLDSVTTVRGTKWLTMDTCRGTVTRVVRGTVVVRDKATGKRHVVTAGNRYLARHRRR